MSTTRDVEERAVGLKDNVRVEVYTISQLRQIEPRFDELSRESRKRVLSYCRPQSVRESHNVTCTAFHELVAAALNERNDRDQLDYPAELAFGTGDASTASPSDTSLVNEVGRIDIVDPSNSGTDFRIDEYVDSLQLNGNTLTELGMFDAQNRMLNHASMTALDKTSSIALTVSVAIPVSDAST